MNPIYVGHNPLQSNSPEVQGQFVDIEGEDFYKISNYDQMRPFFIGVVSDSDHWLYLSSSGGLTAGRRNPESSLFPYYTDDKIHDSGALTGSKTILLVEKEGKTFLWEPFSDNYAGVYQTERNIYKNTTGNRIILEETNSDLGLTYSYGWNFSKQYGFIKKCRLENRTSESIRVRLVDGLQNILPYGVDLKMQSERSTLLDAYKKNELLDASGLGLFLLSSIPVDKAEPSEALKATTVWQTGLSPKAHLLSVIQLDHFRRGADLNSERDVRAERGAYLVESELDLASGTDQTWYFVAEIKQTPSEVATLDQWIRGKDGLEEALERDIADGTKALHQIVAAADGLQLSKDKLLNARHFANVLFNVMRGGIFDHNYDVHKQDLQQSISQYNKEVSDQHADFFAGLPQTIRYTELMQAVDATDDTDLKRLCREYLPLIFSRRHGDPSRPWNRFSIELEDEEGNKKLYYQGNWRDIFQNWEALALSYPRFIESMISKFLSASTPDGYNPYRVTRDGIDWEVIEEDDPWSYIGYWGDHQIIYLLRLLELSRKHHPGALTEMLNHRQFAYANVPYRIRGYEALLADPQDTVDFDHQLEADIQERVGRMGADGKLVLNQEGKVHHVNLLEKLLVTLLSKLSNFIPEGGIWLNTQRPEWNDANNALVGYGVSMVTLYYIRRYVAFFQSLLLEVDSKSVTISEEVGMLLQSIAGTLERHESKLTGPLGDQLRREILDELGKAGELYRNQVYSGFTEKTTSVDLKELNVFLTRVLTFTDHSIQQNRRSDNLYHSYNLMRVEKDGSISIRYLYEMLEGQVAVLSSGYFGAKESSEVLEALRNSDLYRADQHSYILYPDRQLPRFEVKNQIPEEAVSQSRLLTAMVAADDRRLIEKDVAGVYHFHSDFRNAKNLATALEAITDAPYAQMVKEEKEQLLDVYESVFDHQSFTGRSGTFFGYEGLGCIYWHMVSKLILAAQENVLEAIRQGADADLIKDLTQRYYDLRAGLGTHKHPENYGAFPFDAYSHTPGNAGAQQPGMTGQVKEDILSRFGELGVFVENGQIIFRPDMLQREEFLMEESTFSYFDIQGAAKEVTLPVGSLAFTYCQVPVIYKLSSKPGVKLHLSGNDDPIEFSSLEISAEWSDSLMRREEKISMIEVLLSTV